MARSTRHILVAIGLVAIVYLATLATLPRDGFWVVDNANKFLQVENILQNPRGDFSIRWPGQALDPTYEYNPMPWKFSFVKDGKLFSLYSPIFAWISAWPFRWLGVFGLHVLPLASSPLMLAGLVSLAGALSERKHTGVYAVLIGGLCTPVWFYSVVFWEHTLTLCLSVWALWFCLRFLSARSRRSLVIGTALAALSAYFREDQYLFCIALASAVAVAARPARFKTLAMAGLIMLVTWIPLWCFQHATLGTALGYHISAGISQETGGGPLSLSVILRYLRPRPTVVYNLFFASYFNVPISLLVAAPFVLLFLLRPSLQSRAFNVAMPLAGLLASVASVVVLAGYLGNPIPLVWLLKSNGLYAAAPVILLSCFSSRQPESAERNTRWLWAIGLGYAVLYSLAAPVTCSIGVHWGNRYLLLLYPLLSVLAAVNVAEWFSAADRNRFWRHGLIVLCLILSVLTQIYSADLLRRKLDYSARLNHEVGSRPESVIITDAWWAPQEMYSVFNDKMIFYINQPRMWPPLREKLKEAGFQQVLLVTQRQDLSTNAVSAVVNDSGLDYFSVGLIPLSLSQ